MSHSSLTYYIVTYSKYPKKSVDIWATFAIKFVTNTFQKKSPSGHTDCHNCQPIYDFRIHALVH